MFAVEIQNEKYSETQNEKSANTEGDLPTMVARIFKNHKTLLSLKS